MIKKPVIDKIISPKKIKDIFKIKKNKEEDKFLIYKSNIKVGIRIRPLNNKEKNISLLESIKVIDKNTVYVLSSDEIYNLTNNKLNSTISKSNLKKDSNSNSNNNSAQGKYYNFTNVFSNTKTQEQLYQETNIKENVLSLLQNNNNISIISYGIEKSGKSYSMFGDGDNPGLVPRILDELFSLKEKILNNKKEKVNKNTSLKYKFNGFTNSSQTLSEINFKINLISIENEAIKDLINSDNNNDNSKILVKEDKSKGIIPIGIEEKTIVDISDIYKIIDKSLLSKKSESNKIFKNNIHILLIFYVEFELTSSSSGLKESIFKKIIFADLASSEKNQSINLLPNNNKGTSNKSINNMPKSINIDKGLINLSKCIDALIDNSQTGKGYVPWKDSVLTKLLKDGLEGSSKSYILINVTPSILHVEESIQSIEFGLKACNIKESNKNYEMPKTFVDNADSNIFNRKDNKHVIEEKPLSKYEEDIEKYSNELQDLKHSLANQIHNQHLTNSNNNNNSNLISTFYNDNMNTSVYSKKENNSEGISGVITKLLSQIHTHFNLEISTKKELIQENRKLEITKNELISAEYQLFKLKYDNDNIVNKTKGINLKIKELENTKKQLNDKLIKLNNIILEKNTFYLDNIFNKRTNIQEKVNKLVSSNTLNEVVASMLDVSYQYYKLQVDKLDQEFKDKLNNFNIRKNDWEIYKLITQINYRDKGIESFSNELKDINVVLVDLSKDIKESKNINDFKIKYNLVFNSNHYNLNNITTNKLPDVNLTVLPTIKNYNKNKINSNFNNNINESFDNTKDNKLKSSIKFNNNYIDPYNKTLYKRKNYFVNPNNSAKKVKEVSQIHHDYSDYHNPGIFKHKTKFNTKTSKVIEESQKGKLTEFKLRMINNLYPNSKIDLLNSDYRNKKYNNDKNNISIYSNKSNKSKNSNNNNYNNNNKNNINFNNIKNTYILNTVERPKSGILERSIDKKINNLNIPKSLVNRYRGSPFFNT